MGAGSGTRKLDDDSTASGTSHAGKRAIDRVRAWHMCAPGMPRDLGMRAFPHPLSAVASVCFRLVPSDLRAC